MSKSYDDQSRFYAPRSAYFLGPVIVAALGGMTIASAQSPFANNNKSQAWEQPSVQTAPPPRTPQVQAAPQVQTTPQGRSVQTSQIPSSQNTPPQGPSNSMTPRTYPPQTTPPQNISRQNKASSPSSVQSYPPAALAGAYNYSDTSSGQPHQSSTSPFAPSKPSNYNQPQYNQPANTQAAPQAYPPQNYPPQTYPSQTYPSQAYPPQTGPQAPRSWKDKMGLGRLTKIFRGFIKGGAAAVNHDSGAGPDWKEEFVGDAKAEFEVSAVTDSGYEYGFNLEGRAQYDKFRRGFGGRISDCPPTVAGCSSTLVGGIPTSLRGHTSRFYTEGPNEAEEGQIALESAHLFLRSAYGDITLGRDDGAAYLFSLGAPSLLGVGASNSSVDYTGLDSVKTVNDASGFSEKVTYTSPRLLGDKIGVGVQFGGSYALNARACGVDYCVKQNDGTGTVAPDLEDILEVGVALDRRFDNGLKVEGTATYARGTEKSGFAGLDDLQSYNFGAEMSWADVTLGGSFLKSNNGLLNGDYKSWDIGATWKPSDLGFTLGYGHATDENVKLSSDQYVAGLTYDFNKFRVGAGAQYIERETQAFTGTSVIPQTEKATALFVEGRFEF